MSRIAAVHVREARPEDAADLITLVHESSLAHEVNADSTEDCANAIAHTAADPDARLYVAVAAEQVVGCLKATRAPLSPLQTKAVLHTSFLLVSPAFRGNGIARALLDEACVWAEEKDIETVTAFSNSQAREINRYLARLGLTTVATVRYASTASLRAKLSPHRGTISGRQIGRVIAQRRTLRRRHGAAV